MGYNSQLVRPSELGSSSESVAAGGVECYHVTHWSIGRYASRDDECSGVGRASIRPGIWSFILTPILSVVVSGDVVQWTAITFSEC